MYVMRIRKPVQSRSCCVADVLCKSTCVMWLTVFAWHLKVSIHFCMLLFIGYRVVFHWTQHTRQLNVENLQSKKPNIPLLCWSSCGHSITSLLSASVSTSIAFTSTYNIQLSFTSSKLVNNNAIRWTSVCLHEFNFINRRTVAYTECRRQYMICKSTH